MATPQVIVPRSPTAVIAINDRYRRPDVPDSEEGDLRPLAFYSPEPAATSSQGPCLVPPECLRPELMLGRRGFRELLKTYFVDDVQSLFPLPENVIAAGGAVALATTGVVGANTDLDLFVYGLHEPEALWAKLEEIRACLNELHIQQACIAPGVATFWLLGGTKVQVILRPYGSISAVLHGFDLASCAFAYDGRRVFTTTYGAYAYLYELNPVNPAYCSPSYEFRLEKYFKRGFGLALPHMILDRWEPGAEYSLPRLEFRLLAPTDRAPWPGAWTAVIEMRAAGGATSDYDCGVENRWQAPHQAHPQMQIRRLLAGKPPCAIVSGSLEGFCRRHATKDTFFDEITIEWFVGRIKRYGLRYDDDRKPLQGLAKRFIDRVQRDLRQDDAERKLLCDFADRVQRELQDEDANRELIRGLAEGQEDFTKDFTKDCTALIAKIRDRLRGMRGEPIEWWVTQGVCLPRSAPGNPRPETVASWYGQVAASAEMALMYGPGWKHAPLVARGREIPAAVAKLEAGKAGSAAVGAEASRSEAEASTDEPEAGKSETDKPKPDESEPDKSEPDESETSEPETDESETSEPETDESETSESEPDESEAGGSEADPSAAGGSEADPSAAGEVEAGAPEAGETAPLWRRALRWAAGLVGLKGQ